MLLVRHSVPEVDPSVPAAEWRLSAQGRRRCDELAERVAPYEPAAILSSPEPKALETAELLAAWLGLRLRESADLREHERRTVGWLERDELEARIRRLFAEREEVVFGEESAADAEARFSRAIEGLDERTVVVTHGTVLSLYVAARTGRDPYEVWSRLELPDLIVL